MRSATRRLVPVVDRDLTAAYWALSIPPNVYKCAVYGGFPFSASRIMHNVHTNGCEA